MQWFLWGLAVVVVGLAALVAAGRFGGMPATAVHDSPIPEFPTDRDLDGADLRRVRFAIATRGYSMAQVDDLLDRLASELDRRGYPAPAPGTGSALVEGSDIDFSASEASEDADVTDPAR